jgi:site-specific DNA-methyltransferase (adenine-specific)
MDIKFDKRNYRKHNDKNKELINKSLAECGAGRSILIDAEDEIIAGNGVFEQAQELGIPVKVIETDGSELIAVKRTDLATQDEKRKRLAVMDNSSSDTSEFDLELLQDDFEVPDLQEMGIDLPDIEVAEKEVVEDDVPEEVETRCKRGDIWKLGEHRLMCGDSTCITDVDKLMNGEKADMVFTDPPYGVSYEGGLNEKKKKQIKNDALTGNDLYNMLYGAFTNIKLNTKEKSGIYIFYAIKTTREFINALFDAGLKQRGIIAWHKLGGGFGDYMAHYMNAYEPCIYASNGESVNWYGASNEKTLWEIEKEKSCDLHPTMKPIAVVSRAVQNSSKVGDFVLDLFGGSGSTLIACEQLNRKCFMMELDEHYCDVIITRWENLTGKTAERIADENN